MAVERAHSSDRYGRPGKSRERVCCLVKLANFASSGGFLGTDRTADGISIVVLMVPTAIVFLISLTFVDHLLGQESEVFRGELDHVALFSKANT